MRLSSNINLSSLPTDISKVIMKFVTNIVFTADTYYPFICFCPIYIVYQSDQ